MDSLEAASFVGSRLAAIGDRDRAAAMAAYMKTEMPFYGVKRPDQAAIWRELNRRWSPVDRAEYVDLVTTLWSLPHREEKYAAIAVARSNDRFVTRSSLPLYKRMTVQGAWWDLVDDIAIRLVGRVLDKDRAAATPALRTWIGHRDLWVRRSAIICQVGHKDRTDVAFLFDACSERAHETDFFIRKAIGWALREFAKTDPAAVRSFVAENESRLSGLSRREATKHL